MLSFRLGSGTSIIEPSRMTRNFSKQSILTSLNNNGPFYPFSWKSSNFFKCEIYEISRTAVCNLLNLNQSPNLLYIKIESFFEHCCYLFYCKVDAWHVRIYVFCDPTVHHRGDNRPQTGVDNFRDSLGKLHPTLHPGHWNILPFKRPTFLWKSIIFTELNIIAFWYQSYWKVDIFP